MASVVSDDLDVPPADWGAGFPGLSADLREWFAIRFAGSIRIPEAGVWTFKSCSDGSSSSSSRLMRSGRSSTTTGSTPSSVCKARQLPAGWVRLRYDFFQGPRFLLGLQLQYRGPSDSAFRDIEPEELSLSGFEEVE